MLPEQYQLHMGEIGQYLSIILRLFSSSQRINVHKYKDLCTRVYLMWLQCFRNKENKCWISITPSLHKLLAHSWELIQLNEDCGLKAWDESGLESNNKVLRTIRQRLARKISQSANIHDVINRLWLISDPKINLIELKTKPFCTNCNEYGHSIRSCHSHHPMLGPLNSDEALFKDLLC